MPSVIKAECRYAECRYTECRYAECRYAECRYAECRRSVSTLNRYQNPFMSDCSSLQKKNSDSNLLFLKSPFWEIAELSLSIKFE